MREIAQPVRVPNVDILPNPNVSPPERVSAASRVAPTVGADRWQSPELAAAVTRHARIVKDMRFSNSVGDPYSAQQRAELAESRAGLNALRPHGRHDLETALANDAGLIAEAAKGRTVATLRAMQLEAEMRDDPQLRADTFVQRWQALERQRRLYMRDHENSAAARLSDRMLGMAKGLERDPQVESILRNRKLQLGLSSGSGPSIASSLADMAGRGRGRGLGI